MELLMWWNLLFITPIFLAALYGVGMAFGGDHGGDHEAELEAGPHVPMLEAGDVSHDITAEHSGLDGHDHDPGLVLRSLSLLGVGRVPLSAVLITMMMSFGIIGLGANTLLQPILRIPWVYFWFSLGIATIGSLLSTRFLSGALAKVMPSTQTFVTKGVHMLGMKAEALTPITATSGIARLYDAQGYMQQVQVRTRTGEPEIAAGGEVVLAHFDETNNIYQVRPYQFLETPAERNLLGN